MSPVKPNDGILTITASVTPLLTMTASVNANNADAYIVLAFPIQETADDLTFTRASGAGFVDSDGEVQEAAVDTPRSAHYYEDGS